ncbi:MAG: hypothetical protein ACC631_09120 [Halocynthiibacter sp.]
MNQLGDITGAASANPMAGLETFAGRTRPGFAGDKYESDWEALLLRLAQTSARNTGAQQCQAMY